MNVKFTRTLKTSVDDNNETEEHRELLAISQQEQRQPMGDTNSINSNQNDVCDTDLNL